MPTDGLFSCVFANAVITSPNNMATQTDTLKRELDNQIAGQIAYAKVTQVVQAKGKAGASSQTSKAKKSPKKGTKKKK